jgi:hypothetical protein
MEQNSGQQRGDRETSQKKPDMLDALITIIIAEIYASIPLYLSL